MVLAFHICRDPWSIWIAIVRYVDSNIRQSEAIYIDTKRIFLERRIDGSCLEDLVSGVGRNIIRGNDIILMPMGCVRREYRVGF